MHVEFVACYKTITQAVRLKYLFQLHIFLFHFWPHKL